MTDRPSSSPEAGAGPLRGFGFTFGFVSAGLGLFLLWRGRTGVATGLLGAAVVFFALGALVPGVLRPLYGPWMRFAEILGHVNTKLLLGLFYFVGMTPTGLLMRLAGKDPMTRTFRGKPGTSYWSTPTVHPDGTRHFERQF